MVTVQFCDKCEREIRNSDTEENMLDGIDNFKEMFESFSGKQSLLLQPTLCNDCVNGYAKIIEDTNKKIVEFVKDKTIPKKKGIFGRMKT